MELQQVFNYIWSIHYLRAIVIFIVAYIAMQVSFFIFEKILLQLTKKTKTTIDDEIVEGTTKPASFLLLVIGARIAAETLQFSPTINMGIQRVISSVMILLIAHIVSIIIHILIMHWAKNGALKAKAKIDEELMVMFHRLDKVIVYLIAAIYILNVWGVQIGPLLASLGVAGVAVAFALQTTLGNVFGGMAIIGDKAFKIGDVIQLEDGTVGTVEKISFRSTKLKTPDNEIITVPNGKLADSKIKNLFLPTKQIRVTINFGVEYGSDIQKVKKVVMDIVKKDKDVQKDPAPQLFFMNMGESSLNFTLYFFVDDIAKKFDMVDRINTVLYNTLNQHKIGIPFPTRTLYLKK